MYITLEEFLHNSFWINKDILYLKIAMLFRKIKASGDIWGQLGKLKRGNVYNRITKLNILRSANFGATSCFL